jgi:hypothetical protein
MNETAVVPAIAPQSICVDALLEKYAKGGESSVAEVRATRARWPRPNPRRGVRTGRRVSARRWRTASFPQAASTPLPACSCRPR